MTLVANPHYGKKYFSWYASWAEFGGWANQSKFWDFIGPHDDVLDFGCGGGYLLREMRCRRKVGIEINPEAITQAQQNGLEVYSSTLDVPDESADVIVSNNALEHTRNPLEELRNLYPKLRPGGRIIFVVPCESVHYLYQPNDINNHLFSWSPMSLGNLFVEAGYDLITSHPYIHRWPPHYQTIARWGGRRIFEMACRFYGRWKRDWTQVRAVARRPE
jgi:SAM-dependent methyltransferase